MSQSIKFAVLTSSDSGHKGERQDIGGDAVAGLMAEHGHELIDRALEPDDQSRLSERLRSWAKRSDVEIVLTTGGTGLAPRDVMPEATRSVIEYEVPGIAEAMRSASLAITKMAMLSRGLAGVVNQTLIINLPGSPKGAVETLEVVMPVLAHAVEIMRDTHLGDHPIERHGHNH